MPAQHRLSLLPSEITHHQYDAAITLATIFVGDMPSTFLSARVAAILSKNPWLKARLTATDNSQFNFEISDSTALSDHYQEVNIADICENASIECFMNTINTPPLQPALAALFTKQGFKCINNDTPLFKVSLCQSDNNTFVLLVSMSHVLGDGATLYQIYKMLSQDAEIISLTPDRDMNFQQKLEQLNPSFSPIPAQMAVIYQKLGENNQAVDKMYQALAISPERGMSKFNK